MTDVSGVPRLVDGPACAGADAAWPRGTGNGGRPLLLVVEDEERIARFLCHGLSAEGYEAHYETTAEAARHAVRRLDPDLLMLDLMLPGVGGLELLDEVHARHPRLPVLVVSARRDLATRLAALRAGACDFVVKPFAFDELVERVAIHLRAVERPVDPVLRAGSLVLDVRSREVHLAGGSVKLSEREFSLLEQLARHHGHVVSRERLLSAVWGYSFRSGTNALDVCVNRLRHKLGARHIETVRSAGYRLVG